MIINVGDFAVGYPSTIHNLSNSESHPLARAYQPENALLGLLLTIFTWTSAYFTVNWLSCRAILASQQYLHRVGCWRWPAIQVVSYDRTGIYEQYSLAGSRTWSFGAIVLRIAVKGILSSQRPTWMKHCQSKDSTTIEPNRQPFCDLCPYQPLTNKDLPVRFRTLRSGFQDH